MTPDQVAALRADLAALTARMDDVLRRLDRIETRMDDGDAKRDAAREEARGAHGAMLARLEGVETAQATAAAQGRWRWGAWQALVGLVAVAGGLVAMAVAIADHT